MSASPGNALEGTPNGRMPSGARLAVIGRAVAANWRALRKASPRTFAGLTVGLTLLLTLDLVLAYGCFRYERQLMDMRAAMTQTERGRVDAIAASEQNRLALAVEFARREALGDQDLHLAVDTERGFVYLERQGMRLREMRARLGPEATIGIPPDDVILAPPLGKRLVARVVDGSYSWTVPDWVYTGHDETVPVNRRVAGALGAHAVFLDSGAVIYSRPTSGPLSRSGFVLPGSVRMEAVDLEAIRADLRPGMAVYFH